MTSGLLKEGELQSTLLKAEHIDLLHLPASWPRMAAKFLRSQEAASGRRVVPA